MRIIRINMTTPADPRSRSPLPSDTASRVARDAAVRQRSSRDLLGDGDRLLIEHAGETYVLRLTRQGKLILTK